MSAPRLEPLAKLTSTNDRKRRPLRRVLCLTKGRTLRSRQGEGLQLHSPCLPLERWAHHRPGDELIPANAERVGWEGGLVFFRGTRHHPLIMFQTELEAQHQVGQQLRLWCVELIDHEPQSMDASRTELWSRPGLPTCLISLLGQCPTDGTTGATLGRTWMHPAVTVRWE